MSRQKCGHLRKVLAGNMAAWLGNYDAGFAHSTRALVAARELDEVLEIGMAHIQFGVLVGGLGRLPAFGRGLSASYGGPS